MPDYAKDSFYDIAVQAADLNPATAAAQRKLIDNVTSESPILAGIPFEQASHLYHNVFERMTDVDGIDVIDFDGPLPEIGSNTQLDQVTGMRESPRFSVREMSFGPDRVIPLSTPHPI